MSFNLLTTNSGGGVLLPVNNVEVGQVQNQDSPVPDEMQFLEEVNRYYAFSTCRLTVARQEATRNRRIRLERELSK